MNRKFISLFLVVLEVPIIDTSSRNVFVIAETKYLHFATSVNTQKCLFTGFDTVVKALMNLSVFVKLQFRMADMGKKKLVKNLSGKLREMVSSRSSL